MINNNGTTGGKIYLACMRRFDLMFNLEAREQRYVILIPFDYMDIVWHDRAHESPCLLVDIVRVD